MIDFQEEAITLHLLDEMVPLMADHHREIAQHKDIKLEPDFEHYILGFRGGMFRCYTVRESGDLVGYAVFVVRFHPHYKSSLQAFQEVLFLSKRCRRGLDGLRFMRWCEGRLAADGVQIVTHHVTGQLDFSPILERLGYSPAEIVYTKRLK